MLIVEHVVGAPVFANHPSCLVNTTDTQAAPEYFDQVFSITPNTSVYIDASDNATLH